MACCCCRNRSRRSGARDVGPSPTRRWTDVTGDRARTLLSQITGVTVVDGGPAITVLVPAEQLPAVAAFVKETIGCAFFAFSTAIDYKADGLETVAFVENL